MNRSAPRERKHWIETIREYEESVSMPKKRRRTMLANGEAALKPSAQMNDNELRHMARRCKGFLRFGDAVDAASLEQLEDFALIEVCRPPVILRQLGLSNAPMMYTQRHLRDALHAKSKENYHWHGLSVEQVKRIPELLEKPVMLAESPTRRDAVIAVLQACDEDGDPLMAAILPDKGKQSRSQGANVILSVYGKSDFARYARRTLRPEYVLYLNKERWRGLERLTGIRFPSSYKSLATNRIIKQPECITRQFSLERKEPPQIPQAADAGTGRPAATQETPRPGRGRPAPHTVASEAASAKKRAAEKNGQSGQRPGKRQEKRR